MPPRKREHPASGCAPRAQPCCRLVQKWSWSPPGPRSRRRRPTTRGRSGSSSSDRHRERRRVEQQRAARARRRRRPAAPAEHRPDDRADREASSPRSALAGCRLHRRDGGGQQPGERRREERVGGAVHRGEHHQVHRRRPVPVSSSRPAVSWVTQPDQRRRRSGSACGRAGRPTPRPAAAAPRTAGTARPTPAPRRPTPPPTDEHGERQHDLVTRSPRIESTWLPNSSRYCGSSRSTAGIRTRLVSTGQG